VIASACADSLGYDLSEPLPDHSSLSRIRARSGLEVFRRFVEAIVEQCIGAGMVWGQELSIDATKVAANAARGSLQPRFAVKTHLAHLFATPGDPGDGDLPNGSPGGADGREAPVQFVRLTDAAQTGLAESAELRHDWIGKAGRPNRRTRSGGYRRTADSRISTTDPDATPMRQGDGHPRLGYQDHDVVDGGQARIMLAALVAPAEVQENQPALDLLWRTRFRGKLRPRQITGDTNYGTVANIVEIEDQGIRAYVPLSEAGYRPGVFQEQDFIYDTTSDTYRCPGSQVLCFLSQCDTTRRRIYAALAAACPTCRLQTQCTTSRRGRRISRSLDADTVDRVRGYHQTASFAIAIRKRRVWVESLFAEAKDWHGLRRFRREGWSR
jgi:hypothetical protein